jgi:hypothetical protein
MLSESPLCAVAQYLHAARVHREGHRNYKQLNFLLNMNHEYRVYFTAEASHYQSTYGISDINNDIGYHNPFLSRQTSLIMVFVKDRPEYTDLDAEFKPLPKYGHYSETTPGWEAIAPDVRAAIDQLWTIPDFPTIRKLMGNPDAAMPPGGPDRYKEVNTELTHFPARDGHMVELKIYKSPQVKPDATCVYRMHGGGMHFASSAVLASCLLTWPRVV